MTINQLSEKLLLLVKLEDDPTELIDALAIISLIELKKQLINDEHKKAFWVNIYNAFFQILRLHKQIEKPSIYRDKHFVIAGLKFSLDDVEHGILRKYRYKFLLGYLPNPFFPSLIKKLAVSKIDYRVHFALNCGAKSCPPIGFYTADRINAQLNIATKSFLESETDVIENAKEIHISRLFQWFLGDFGGKAGIGRILQEHLNISTQDFKLVYKPYSWEENLGNYID